MFFLSFTARESLGLRNRVLRGDAL